MTQATVLVVSAASRLNADLIAGLRDRGYVCVMADTTAVATEQFLTHRPALVLLDLPFSDASARELTEAFQQFDPAVALVVTGTDAVVSSAADAFDLGADEDLQQPTPDPLLAAV